MNRRTFLQKAGAGSTALALSASAHGAPADSVIGAPADKQTAAEFLMRSDQAGPAVTHYGYLTHLFGLADGALFSHPETRTEATARFTLYAVTTLDSRHEHGNIITTSAPGELAIYLNPAPSGDFNLPESFTRGKPIATFSLRYHNVLNVQAPNQGVVAASVDLVQTRARPFTLDQCRLRFGRHGLRARLSATGQGTRTQPEPLEAFFLIGGHIVITDS
jgi:hypothetical protein